MSHTNNPPCSSQRVRACEEHQATLLIAAKGSAVPSAPVLLLVFWLRTAREISSPSCPPTNGVRA